ncbi:hypothetical protein DSO57_1000587 [Entomophthora muscae]|uniref:Uncharacterized protein n=1 Tax=Entomophthora muscae TaxID=34485 RepID=A0ACC2S0C4_9FUNG|nr:hypothetical protein DSO57_1000587 [Entomophthora muscae]
MTVRQLENYINNKVAGTAMVSLIPLPETPSAPEAKILEATAKYTLLFVANLPRLAYLPLNLWVSVQDNTSSSAKDQAESENEGLNSAENNRYCSGLKGQPHINCALALNNQASVTDAVTDRQGTLEKDVQDLARLVEMVNEKVSLLVPQAVAMNNWINGIAGTLAVHKIQINGIETVATKARYIGGQNSFTLDIVEESLCLL